MNYQLPLLIAVVLIVVFGLSMAGGARAKRAELERRLSVTEGKLNQVIKKLSTDGTENIEPIGTPPVASSSQQANQFGQPANQFGPLIDPTIQQAEMGVGFEAVQDCLLQGRKIEAIKLYRQLTGVGLKDAKDAVERMAGGR